MTAARRAPARVLAADAGFTLLELMVVLVLMVGVASLGLGGLRAGNQVWQRTETLAAGRLEDEALGAFLSDLLASAVPLRPRSASRVPPVLFDGNAQGLRMVARLPSRLATPGEYLIELALDPTRPAGTPRELRLAWQLLADITPRPTPDRVEVLAEDVVTLELAYGDGAGVTSQWTGRATLPRSIAVRIGRGGQQDAVALVVWLPLARGPGGV